MIRIENDTDLYECEFGSYSYFEDREARSYLYLPHSCGIMQNDFVKEWVLTKIDIVNSILKNTNRSSHWIDFERREKYQNVIRLLRSNPEENENLSAAWDVGYPKIQNS